MLLDILGRKNTDSYVCYCKDLFYDEVTNFIYKWLEDDNETDVVYRRFGGMSHILIEVENKKAYKDSHDKKKARSKIVRNALKFMKDGNMPVRWVRTRDFGTIIRMDESVVPY